MQVRAERDSKIKKLAAQVIPYNHGLRVKTKKENRIVKANSVSG